MPINEMYVYTPIVYKELMHDRYTNAHEDDWLHITYLQVNVMKVSRRIIHH